MRILFLNYEFPPLGGGASPISYEIAQGYVNIGHQVDVVTMGFKGLAASENMNGINVYRVPCIRAKKEICHPHEMLTFIYNAQKFLKKHLKENQYDVCHNHFAIPTGLVANWVKKNYGIPFINTSHGSDIPGYNNDRFLFLHNFTKPILNSVLNNSSGNFSGSNYLAGLANKNINPPVAYQTIREGFFPDLFQPQAKKKTILSTGRLLRRKGFQYLIEAVSEKDIGYEVHICGDGPMMPELRSLAEKSKTKIVFHGWINNQSEKYKNLLETASIYSLVSAKENASKSLLEALSAGCAVITSNIAGCPESVGDAGFAIPAENVSALRETIYDLIDNEDKIQEYGKKARNRILEVYNWDKLIRQYEKELMKAANIESKLVQNA